MSEDKDSPSSDVQKWLQAISAYETTFKKWESRAEKINKKFKDEGRPTRDSGSRFNILWSNVDTLVPACFSRLPKPSVSRRHRDNDPVGRVAATLLERALEFEIEHYGDYRAAMHNSVYDRFLGGRGISWVRYEPHFQKVENQPEDGLMITEDADEAEIEGGEQEEISYECAPCDYVHWKDFGHKIARTWEEVDAVWRKVYMGEDALEERFGPELAKRIPLDTRPDEQKKAGADGEYQAVIYEIWDKASNSALWLSKSLGEIVDEREDPLKLESFFPCPRPLYATLTSDSLVPTPDYTLYQDQAQALDTLSDRIDGLIKALQVKGVYDASIPELARLFTEGENGTLIPVKNWMAFAEKQGLKGSLDIVEILPIAQALGEAYKAFAQVKQEIYDITGLADIIRGSSDPRETAEAIKTKGQFGSMRLRMMQAQVAQYAQEILQIKAQIMCQLFQPETLLSIGGAQQMPPEDQQLIPQAIELLKNKPLRGFRIEISADSMIFMDEQQEKADRLEFLKAAGPFLETAAKVSQEFPLLAPVIADMLKFSVTSFKAGKELEGEFDNLADKLKQMAQQPQPPKQDPKIMAIQAQAQTDSQQLQMKNQLDMQLLQAKTQADQQKMQADIQVEQQKQALQAQQVAQQNQLEAQRQAQQEQLEAQAEQQRQAFDLQAKQLQLAFDKWKAELDNNTKIIVAELQAKTTLQTAAMSASSKDETTDINTDGTTQPKSGLAALVESMNANMEKLMGAVNQPKPPMRVIRDASGQVSHLAPIEG